ncbi:MAG: hypothetical protein R3314_10770 [Longimicrobiales bacterium]|nr:hypothetical protein [Longimicrobiales bacterium]
MRRIRKIGFGLVGTAVLVAGCGDEGPTEVGGDLLGPSLRTVQVTLEASEFLERDTTYDRLGMLATAPFAVVATDFASELDAHALVRINRPFRVTFTNGDGQSVSDSVGHLKGGTLTLVLDSLMAPTLPLELEVLEVTESWDPNTVTWSSRVDTLGSPAELWSVPGGTTGSVMATASWTEGDTLRIPIDSAAASVWHDTTGARLGGLIRMTTTEERLRLRSADFEFDVRPLDNDTVVPGGSVARMVSIASPDSAPPAGVLRVGGRPAWRSLVRFRPLDGLTVPCEQGSTTCEIPLSEVTVNTANLLVWTQPVGGRRVESSMRVEGRAVLEGPGTPLSRSPLSRPFGRMAEGLQTSDFEPPAATLSRIPITGFVQRNARVPEGEVPLLWLALTAVGEKSLFGYGAFDGVTGTNPPRLELVVTIPVRKVDP